jgi:hypothetical protein
MTDFLFEHMPFFAAAGVIAVLEYVIPSKRFGRKESLLLLAVSAAFGFFWLDPEGKDWDRMTSVAYFVCAGLVGLTAVSVAKGMGYKIKLPGDKPPNEGTRFDSRQNPD